MNGWTVHELLENWFPPGEVVTFHASREAFRVGNSKTVVRVNEAIIVEEDE